MPKYNIPYLHSFIEKFFIMKKRFTKVICTLLYSCFLSALILSGCSKNGDAGPQGEKGEQGIAGVDGSTLLSGNGTPAATLGKNGDYYLDKTAVAIYGPKTASGWGSATSLKGETGNNGANGADGSKILSGTDVPSPTLGTIGDFYFDTQNIAIYGPKTTSGWGNPVSLKAPEANGVTTLLYRNHAFQSVVRSVQQDTYWQSQIQQLENDKASAESSIASYQQQYDQNVANINADTWSTQEQKNLYLAQALQSFESNTAYYRERLVEIAKQKQKYQQYLAVGNFEMKTEIALDTKYADISDTGMIIIRVKKANDATAPWSDGIYETTSVSNPNSDYPDYVGYDIYSGDDTIYKDKIVIDGNSYLMPETDVKKIKFDIKIVLIPATTVVTMSSKNINVKDAKAVAKFLGL